MSIQAPHPPNVDHDQAHAEANPTEEQQRLDALVLDVYGHLPVRTERRQPFRPWHTCTRCGIKTLRRELCRDCKDVTS